MIHAHAIEVGSPAVHCVFGRSTREALSACTSISCTPCPHGCWQPGERKAWPMLALHPRFISPGWMCAAVRALTRPHRARFSLQLCAERLRGGVRMDRHRSAAISCPNSPFNAARAHCRPVMLSGGNVAIRRLPQEALQLSPGRNSLHHMLQGESAPSHGEAAWKSACPRHSLALSAPSWHCGHRLA